MTSYVKISSIHRGVIDPPEPCSAEENRAITQSHDQETDFVRFERDRPMTFDDWLAEARPFRNSERYRKTRCA